MCRRSLAALAAKAEIAQSAAKGNILDSVSEFRPLSTSYRILKILSFSQGKINFKCHRELLLAIRGESKVWNLGRCYIVPGVGVGPVANGDIACFDLVFADAELYGEAIADFVAA